MPLYSYSNDDRTVTITRYYAIGQNPQRVKHQGAWLYQDLVADHSKFQRPKGQTYPRISESAGVAESQVDEVRADARKRGFTSGEVDVLPDGAMRFGTRRAENKYLRAIGMVNFRN